MTSLLLFSLFEGAVGRLQVITILETAKSFVKHAHKSKEVDAAQLPLSLRLSRLSTNRAAQNSILIFIDNLMPQRRKQQQKKNLKRVRRLIASLLKLH